MIPIHRAAGRSAGLNEILKEEGIVSGKKYKPQHQMNLKYYDEIIKGYFNKFRYVIGENLIQQFTMKGFHGPSCTNGGIIVLGHPLYTPLRKTRKGFKQITRNTERKLLLNRNRLTIYIITLLKTLFKTYFKQDYTISYRQFKYIYQHSVSILSFANRSGRPIIKSLNRINQSIKILAAKRQH